MNRRSPIALLSLAAVGLGLVGCGSGTAPTVKPAQSSRQSPALDQPPPGPALAATDTKRGHIVLLAGSIENPALPTTWAWDGIRWERRQVNEPPLLDGAAMAYDPDVGGVVLFGGHRHAAAAGSADSAMYIWRGTGWSLIPSPD